MKLHNLVKDFVFPCIDRPLSKNSLSVFNINLIEDGGFNWISLKKKLIADLYPKQNIVVHQVLFWRMVVSVFRLTNIHRALQFDQKPCVKTLIDIFVNKQYEAETKVEK